MPSYSALVLPVLALVCSLSVGAAPAPPDIAALIKRGPEVEVGSAAWTALYPPAGSTPQQVPQLWLDRLDEVTRAGLIPAGGANTRAADDLIHAPDGWMGLAQDDGPLPDGETLYRFFGQNNISSTHFYVGGNVLTNWRIFLQARALPGQHFASHSWSHAHMTTLTNVQVVAELGWTMQILADSNFGKILSFWRPPYGEVDDRVRAIARHVFGLTTVIWDNDSEDWQIGVGLTQAQVENNIRGFINGPKAPGMLMLNHELSPGSVNAFINQWPNMMAQGWRTGNIPSVLGLPWYKNSLSDVAPTANISLVANATLPHAVSSSSSSSSSILPSATPSGVLGVAAVLPTSSNPAASPSASSLKSSTVRKRRPLGVVVVMATTSLVFAFLLCFF